MAKSKDLTIWSIVGLVGLFVALWAYPHAYPLLPRGWHVSRTEARMLATERLRDLGEPVLDAYVVSRLVADRRLERRLGLATEDDGLGEERVGLLRDEALHWEVKVYDRRASNDDWTYRARVTLDGRVTALERRPRSALPGGVSTAVEARLEADYVLTEQGFDPSSFVAVEEHASRVGGRTERLFRYLRDERTPRHGIEVEFSGDTLVGIRSWLEAPEEPIGGLRVDAPEFPVVLPMLAVWALLPLVAVPFLRRYHAGEIEVRRSAQILLLMLGLSVALLALIARAGSEGLDLGLVRRVQSTWVWALQLGGLLFLPMALVGALSWSVGESVCHEHHGRRLAAFDALLAGRWGNATVATSAVRGTLAGLGLSGFALGVALAMRGVGAQPLLAEAFGLWGRDALWMGLALLAWALLVGLYGALFGRLFLVSAAQVIAGRAGGVVLSIVAGALLLWVPGPDVVPVGYSLALEVAITAGLVALFLIYDLLTSLLAGCVLTVLIGAWPLLTAPSPQIQFQGALALFVVALPSLLSVRYLGSGKEIVYHREEVPKHVRRIAERERLRLEAETAEGIRRSILPALPARIGGLRLAHAYRPAVEVGGDFYDVVPLADGRLSVAVGDVAGHGVRSSLVMAAVKASLAVQAAADPAVVEVLRTLNKVAFESAGGRLLTTVCYALIDIERGELSYASAGHPSPYLVSSGGETVELESISYPLGVRREIEVAVHVARIESGDRLVLWSDGLVEARPAGKEEPFGFVRLRQSLARHAAGDVEALRDGLLHDLGAFTGPGPLEDDLTLLILGIP